MSYLYIIPGEPVCLRESRAGDPVVDSGYMGPASLIQISAPFHRREILREDAKARGGGFKKRHSRFGLFEPPIHPSSDRLTAPWTLTGCRGRSRPSTPHPGN